MQSKKAIVLCSGGIDSVTTAYYVKKKLNYKKISILFFDYGQRSLKFERVCCKRVARELKAEFFEIKLPGLAKISNSLINIKKKANKISRKQLKNTKKESDKYYVPCRNIIFLSYAMALGKGDIFTGFKNEGRENYPDTTKEFVKEMNHLKKFSDFKDKIIAPLIKKDKEDIIKLGKNLGVDFKNTVSCYIGNNCGYCLSCRLRQEAFYWANIKDPTKYQKKMRDFRTA